MRWCRTGSKEDVLADVEVLRRGKPLILLLNCKVEQPAKRRGWIHGEHLQPKGIVGIIKEEEKLGHMLPLLDLPELLEGGIRTMKGFLCCIEIIVEGNKVVENDNDGEIAMF